MGTYRPVTNTTEPEKNSAKEQQIRN